MHTLRAAPHPGTTPRMSAEAKKDDPAFLYFPTNYRWSMGLLICLSGAPWTGVEIDEVNRVGRALARQGRRRRRLVRGMGPHGRQDRSARPRCRARRPQAHRGVVLHARVALLPDRRALHSSALAAQHGRLCEVGQRCSRKPPPSSAAHASSRSKYRTRTRACRGCWCIPIRKRRAAARARHGVLRRLRRHQGAAIRLRRSRSRRPRRRLPDRRRAGQRRERALPQPAADCRDRALRHTGLRVSRRPQRVRPKAHRRDGAQPRRLLRAARGLAGATLRLLRRLGRAVGLSRNLGAPPRSSSIPARCCRCRCRPSICNGCSASPTAPRR